METNIWLTKFVISAVFCCALIMSGCAVIQPPVTPTPAKVEQREVSVIDEDEVVIALPSNGVTIETLASDQFLSPVITKLLSTAEQQKQLSQWDNAANTIERALRIEPNNAIIWAKLAQIRLAQESWQQAVQLATKSNILAQNNEKLRRENYYLLVQAFTALGDEQKAIFYREKLNR